MSDRWNAHLAMVQGLIDAQKAQRAQRAAAAMAAQPAATTPAPQPFLDLGGGDMWQGGMNGGQVGMPGGIDYGGQPGDMSALGGKLGGLGPMAGGLLGGLAGTALAGPFGGALGAWGGRALAGLLGGPTGTAQPTEPGSIGGDFGPGGSGPNAFGGGLGAMGAAGMGLGLGGLGAMSGNEIMGFGGLGAMDGGSGDAAAEAAAEAAAGGFGGMGDMGMGMGQFQSGGYTGAGHDGVVQPWRKAGVVHEGELVIPAHMVRMMGMLRQGQSATPFPRTRR